MTVAGESQVSVEELLGRPESRPSRWRTLVQWRDWSLPVKLSAITLIPILIALVFGGSILTGQIQRSDRYEQIDRLVELGAMTGALLDGLARERTVTADLLTQGIRASSPELQAAHAEVDRSTAPLLQAAAAAADADSGIEESRQQIDEHLGKLESLRDRVDAGQVGPVEAVAEYSAITDALLAFDTAVMAGIDADLVESVRGLHDLRVAREEVSVQQAIIGYGIDRGGLAPSEFNQVRTSAVRTTDRIDEFDAAASEVQRHDFDSAVRGEVFDEYDRMVTAVLAGQDTGGEAFGAMTAQHWSDVAGTVFSALGDFGERLRTEATGVAGERASEAAATVVWLTALLLLSLALAALVVFVITRQLLRSLAVLRTSALQIAEHTLPTAVRTIQEGDSTEADLHPVPVSTRDEIGEVARAFDAVHSEALRLAAEQTTIRTGYADVFVNLSRRSQSLVQRQLQLLERLERDEEDADQLALLFQLDHFATRMRRNNENLMVLSGAEPGRRSSRPVSVNDVLRAAVSEIEQYQRVTVGASPAAHVVGYVAGDLIRLVAELLDNATAFSAPETRVTMVTRLVEDGALLIDVLDKGIGMNDAELVEANERLKVASSRDLVASRRMGLFVVGRLSARHGCTVTLHGGKDIAGVRATVTVPAGLVMDQQQDHRSSSAVAEHPGRQWGQHTSPGRKQSPGEPLPRRQRNDLTRNETSHRAAEAPAEWNTGERRTTNGVPAPTANEMSGTALFTPLEGESAQEQQHSTGPSAQLEWPATTSPVSSPPPSSSLSGSTGSASTTDPEKSGTALTGAATPDTSDEAAHALGGRQLFTARSTVVSDWWSAVAADGDAEREARRAAVEDAETTPIFDAMVSAWFRSISSDSDNEEQSHDHDWDFAADAGWQTAQEVSQRSSSPERYTDAGLPQRRRGEQLLPGSAEHRGEHISAGKGTERSDRHNRELPVRDPAGVRNRLSSYQDGVKRGRRQQAAPAGAETTPPPSTTDAPSGLPRRQRQETQRTGHGTGDSNEPGRPETGEVDAARSGDGNSWAAPVEDPNPSPCSGSSWAFTVEEQGRMVQPRSESASEDYTSAGLPRRRRGEQLLPGSAVPSGQGAVRTARDPEDVWSRLNSFQRGVRRGRHESGLVSDSSQENVEGE